MKIDVIPHVPNPTMAGGFEPTAPGSADYVMGGAEPAQEGIISAEECEDAGDMLWGIPVMLGGEYLEPPERMRRAWDKALCRYCNKKGIDPDDYIFDELPLIVATAQIGLFMKAAYKNHKKEKTEEKKTDFDSSPKRLEPYTPVEKKTSKYAATQGGDNLPEEEETELPEEIEYEELDAEHNGIPGAAAAGPRTDPESSE